MIYHISRAIGTKSDISRHVYQNIKALILLSKIEVVVSYILCVGVSNFLYISLNVIK